MREIVKVHTIAQWQELTKEVQIEILRNIRLKGRLLEWLDLQNSKPKQLEHHTAECMDCGGVGAVIKYARLPGIHASQIGSSCMLKLYKDMEGAEAKKVVDSKLQLVFDLGHAAHRMLQGYGLRGAWGKHYKPETRINEELQTRAHEYFIESSADADTILTIDDISNTFIYEVGIIHEYKTINSNGFKNLTGAVPKHKQQAILYQYTLDRPITAFLYLNKDTCDIKDFVSSWDSDLWTATETKLAVLNRLYDSGIEPPGHTGFHCKDCEYSFNCSAYDQKQDNRLLRISTTSYETTE
jgi:hypothetical protein